MPDVANFKDGLGLAPAHGHIVEFQVRDAIQGRTCGTLEAVVTHCTTKGAEIAIGGLFRFVASVVKGPKLEGMLVLNPGKVVLPSIHVLLVLPGGDGPNAGQAAAIDPYGRPLVAVEFAGKREEGWDRVVQLLIEPGVSAGRI